MINTVILTLTWFTQSSKPESLVITGAALNNTNLSNQTAAVKSGWILPQCAQSKNLLPQLYLTRSLKMDKSFILQ